MFYGIGIVLEGRLVGGEAQGLASTKADRDERQEAEQQL